MHMLHVICLGHPPLQRVLQERVSLGHLSRALRSPSLRSGPMGLAAGSGSFWVWLLYLIPAQPSPGLSLQDCRSPCPGMDQAQKAGGSQGSGEACP